MIDLLRAWQITNNAVIFLRHQFKFDKACFVLRTVPVLHVFNTMSDLPDNRDETRTDIQEER